VPADEPRPERQEIPLRARGLENVERVDAHPVEDQRQLVHQGDIQIALRVLDHLRRLRHLDRGGAMNAGDDDGTVDRGDDLEGARILAGNHLLDLRERVLPVAGLMRSGCSRG